MTNKDDFKDLTILGGATEPGKKLEAFPNHNPDRYYMVTLKTDEFTCVCPKTGQPDFAKIRLQYAPDKKILESKSLKMYLWSYRNDSVFHEHVINTILDDFIRVVDPHWCKIMGKFNVRGGIGITVEAEHTKTPEAKTALGH